VKVEANNLVAVRKELLLLRASENNDSIITRARYTERDINEENVFFSVSLATHTPLTEIWK